MGLFRYAQFCPLARAAEILGHRWNLLIIRELLYGPKRFSDLIRPLAGVSTSVLAARLAQLEEWGLVTQRELPPPTPASLYELTESGQALLPAVVELARWGVRYLGEPQPGDHIEAEWLELAAITFARRTPTAPRSYALFVDDGEREVAFRAIGGPGGTVVRREPGPADVSIRTSAPLVVLGMVAGVLDPDEALRSGAIRAEGDLSALADFPGLFDTKSESDGSGADGSGPPNREGSETCPSSTE